MVRPEIARHKIASASTRLEQVETLVSRSREQFLADPRDRDLASFYLMLAIQDVIDLAAHWVADAGWPMPADAASTFGLIADQGAIDRELADGLRAAVGLRNRIAHGSGTLDHSRLHDEFSRGVATLRSFLAPSRWLPGCSPFLGGNGGACVRARHRRSGRYSPIELRTARLRV